MNTSATSNERELERAFPGFAMSHLLHIRTSEALDLAVEVMMAVKGRGGVVEALDRTSRGGDVEHRFKVTGMQADQARRLASQLAAMPGAKGASVEHQLVRVIT